MVQHDQRSDSQASTEQTDRITLSTGVILRNRAISVHLLADVLKREAADAPIPPLRYDPDRDRETPDGEDPAYRAALAAHYQRIAEKLCDLSLLFGVAAVEHVPEGVPSPEDDEWTALLAVLNIPVPAAGARRFMAWVKYVAAPTPNDALLVMQPLLRQIGVPAEVQQAIIAAGASSDGATPDAPAPGTSPVAVTASATAAGR